MKAMLHNQALAIDAFQHKRQMAGSEAQAFIQRTRSLSEDFVRREMTATERFETRVQHCQEYECRIRDHVLTLQDECRDHVGSEEMKPRAELQQTLQHESHVVTSTARHIEAVCDQRAQQSEQNKARLEDNLSSEVLQEMAVMRQQLREQEIATQKSHQDAAFDFQCCDLE